MPNSTNARYTVIPRPLSFDRRALLEQPHGDQLPVELELQLSAVQRRHSLREAMRSPRQRYVGQPARRRPS